LIDDAVQTLADEWFNPKDRDDYGYPWLFRHVQEVLSLPRVSSKLVPGRLYRAEHWKIAAEDSSARHRDWHRVAGLTKPLPD